MSEKVKTPHDFTDAEKDAICKQIREMMNGEDWNIRTTSDTVLAWVGRERPWHLPQPDAPTSPCYQLPENAHMNYVGMGVGAVCLTLIGIAWATADVVGVCQLAFACCLLLLYIKSLCPPTRCLPMPPDPQDPTR